MIGTEQADKWAVLVLETRCSYSVQKFKFGKIDHLADNM